MLKTIEYPRSKTYHSDTAYPVLKFYLDVLPEIKTLDLELGYFSTGAISVLAIGMAQFIQNGGVLRIVTNEYISEEDSQLLFGNQEGTDDQPEYIKNDTKLEELKNILQHREQHFYNCLHYLKQNNRLIIQPVKPLGRGIAHNKIGLANDGENQVYYAGSANFTGNALLRNSESIDVSLDWTGDIEATEVKISEFSKRFEKLINKDHSNYLYLVKSELSTYVKDKGITKSLDELLEESFDLQLTEDENHHAKNLRQELQKKNSEFKEKMEKIKSTPKFPFPSGPRPYQVEAYEAWVKNDYKGIFAMATGTGKTLTSLNCLLEEYKELGTYKAVIIVPTIALVNQWKSECESFNFQNVITVSSKEKWQNKISFFNTAGNFIETNFIIIITYASFYRKKFQSYFQKLDSNTLLIGDEAHNMGAGKVASSLGGIHLQKRIGLSATINRKYDDIGNKKIQEFFNDTPPYTYEYTMQMALDKGWLTHYKYYPHIVELDDDEFKTYIEISIRLMKYFDASTGGYRDAPEVEAMLLARKRIIHKAKNKLAAYRAILKEEYKNRGNLKYTLIYVPEGMDPDYNANDDSEESEEDMRLINQYTKEVSDVNFDIMVKQYASKSKGKEDILKSFASGDLHVLTSMKCLDEGVDVPRSELAIFCSSTGNPRQFIQRRGRVLRRAEGKNLATIHDLVVVPRVSKNEGYFNMEKSLFSKELERVVDFAFMAINKQDTFQAFEEQLEYYNLNLHDINDKITQTN